MTSGRRWLERVRDDIREKGLSREVVYNRTTFRRISSYIYSTQKWGLDKREEEEKDTSTQEMQ